MSKFRQLVESLLINYKALTEEAVVYRTYMDEQWLNDIKGNHAGEKPYGCLWGCRDDSWRKWCAREAFPCSANYFEWTLKPGTKVYTINTVEDFVYLLKHYPLLYDDSPIRYKIDFLKLAQDYDAVELTEKGNSVLHYRVHTDDPDVQGPEYKYALQMGLNSWDVPSVCVFYPKNTVKLLGKVKSRFPDYETCLELVKEEPQNLIQIPKQYQERIKKELNLDIDRWGQVGPADEIRAEREAERARWDD